MTSKNSITLILLSVVLLLVPGCATTTKRNTITRSEAFPQMYAEQPGSVVVLPPVNTSTFPEAGEYYLATIAEPLTAAGYNVIPAERVRNIIEQKKLYDTESLYSLPLETLAKKFNADAVLYARLKQWDVTRTSLISRLIISIEAELVSTKTSEQLWRYNTSINIDLNSIKSTGGSVLSLLEGTKKEDVDKATADAIAHALKLNTKLSRDLPFGPEHEKTICRIRTQN